MDEDFLAIQYFCGSVENYCYSPPPLAAAVGLSGPPVAAAVGLSDPPMAAAVGLSDPPLGAAMGLSDRSSKFSQSLAIL